jgi:hypothetical protein
MTEPTIPPNRHEFGALYHQVFPHADREDCRQAWARWRAALDSGYDTLVLHPRGAPPPQLGPDDYWIIASYGPLRFRARFVPAYLEQLPQQWADAMVEHAAMLEPFGENPRARARGFVHNSLINGYVMDSKIAPGIAGAIAWLLTTMDNMPANLRDYHLWATTSPMFHGRPASPARTRCSISALCSRMKLAAAAKRWLRPDLCRCPSGGRLRIE